MKFVMMKDLDGEPVAVNPDTVHSLQSAISKKGPATCVNFAGEDFIRVMGSVDDVANEFRLQQE